MKQAPLNPYLFAGIKSDDQESYVFFIKFGKRPIFRGKDIEGAANLVKKHYPESDVFAKDRKAINVAARRALIWILTAKLGRTLKSTGKLFGLDHSTIIHHRNSFEQGTCAHPSDKIIKKLFEQ